MAFLGALLPGHGSATGLFLPRSFKRLTPFCVRSRFNSAA